MRAPLRLVAAALVAAARGAPVHAQDFASPTRAGTGETPGAFLEGALPAPVTGSGLEMLAIQWDPAAQLTTRALAARGAARRLEWGAGISSSGDGEIGWNALALALGHAVDSHGAAVRALVRRDRAPRPGVARPLGGEAGAGFWSRIGARGRVWASAPMALTTGEAPPLDRGLETGVALAMRDFSAWLSWSAPAGAVDAAERALGVSCESGALALWAEARDRPLRGSLGLRAHRGSLAVAARVDEHPALGETARLSLCVGGGP
jgi:hypothetical protein